MSTLTKVFIIVNLILAIGFTFFALTYFSHEKSYMLALDEEKEVRKEKEKQIRELEEEKKFLVESLTNDVNAANHQLYLKQVEVETLNSKVVQLEVDKRDLQQRLNQVATAHEVALSDIERVRDDSRRLREETESARRERQEAVERADRATQMALEVELLKDDFYSKMNRYHKELLRAQDELKEKKLLLARAKEMGFRVKDLGATPMIRGVVTAVSPDEDVILINVGEQDGVQPGYEFYTYRGDSQFISKVRVFQVYPDWAACSTVEGFDKETRKSDNVTTQFYN